MINPLPDDHAASDRLMAEIAQRDIGAFYKLYAMHAQDVLAYLAARRSASAQPEDLAQEVWLKVWRHSSDYRPDNFRGWLFTIAANEVRAAARRNRTEYRSNLDAELASSHDPGECAKTAELAALQECLRLLSPDQAQMILACSDRQVGALATRLATTPQAIYSRAYKARQKLADCVRERIR